MEQYSFDGRVVSTRYGNSPGLQADDADALREFWRAQNLDTQLLEEAGGPVISMGRQADQAACPVGGRARMTIEVTIRAGKRRVRTVAFELLPGPN
jgi:hypothetical protein